MAAALCSDCDVATADTLELAVDLASKRAKPGQIVLLSPACASFDQFASFGDRGERFRELVLQTARDEVPA
jgi:UDP-N-acetylmuramoylalanine--D-glutamate ligase